MAWVIYKMERSNWIPINAWYIAWQPCRYANMDYIFLSALRNFSLLILFTSYDIACQWKKNFTTHLEDMPPNLHLDLLWILMIFLIPKFHLPGHGLGCQTLFSFNLTPRVGWTDGKGIKQNWSIMNGATSSTKEMGPGAHHDTLDDHWGNLNWRHIIGFGMSTLYYCQ